MPWPSRRASTRRAGASTPDTPSVLGGHRQDARIWKLSYATVRRDRILSPYEFNPANYNPLRDLLTQLIDFDGLRAQETLQLMVCATNVRIATRRVFTTRTSPSTLFWPRRACHTCFKRSRSTARRTETAVIRGILHSPPSCRRFRSAT